MTKRQDKANAVATKSQSAVDLFPRIWDCRVCALSVLTRLASSAEGQSVLFMAELEVVARRYLRHCNERGTSEQQ